MTTQQILALPAVDSLFAAHHEAMNAAKALGLELYPASPAIVNARDAIVAHKRIGYSQACGCDGFETIYGTTREWYVRADVIENKARRNGFCDHGDGRGPRCLEVR